LLAGAVSGMHWCAAFGTEYTLISIKSGGGGEMSQEATAVVVICLVRFLHPCEAHGLLG
jgi:MFS superfamily sulfate permease-like transporter